MTEAYDSRINVILKNWDRLSDTTKALLRSVGINGDVRKQNTLEKYS